jgi:membrane protease YdiL (CAAX protease family)
MINSDLIENIVVYTFTYIPPLIIYIRFWRKIDRSKSIIIIISMIYMVAAVFTQNILPFILVVFNIIYLRNQNENEDYERYKFSIKNFSFFKGLKYSFYSYFVTIIISAATLYLLSRFNVQLKEQEVVTWMANMSLINFLITVPVALIFAPVLEEFVFRWFFFEKVFKNRFGLYGSALLSSIIFATVHFNLKAFPMILWIGLFNCYLIEKKGYWYAVFNHIAFNSITVIVLLLQKI